MHLLVEDALTFFLFFFFFYCTSLILVVVLVALAAKVQLSLTRHHPHSPVVNIYDTLKNNSIGS